MVVNNCHELAPWADILYAMDSVWWLRYQPNFKGERLTQGDSIPHLAGKAESMRGENSGQGAMLLARHRGASKIILLGFDCKPAPDGRRHWHGEHRHDLPNALSMNLWAKQHESTLELFAGIDVVNCSRDTALKLFPIRNLEDELSC